jgi:pyrroloquinoline quinone biosynthesis protein D
MTEVLSQDTVVRIAPTFRFQWEPAQNAHVLLYPEGMVKLNPSASEILKHCDGKRSISQIIAELKVQFPDADLEADVMNFLHAAQERGWIKAV